MTTAIFFSLIVASLFAEAKASYCLQMSARLLDSNSSSDNVRLISLAGNIGKGRRGKYSRVTRIQGSEFGSRYGGCRGNVSKELVDYINVSPITYRTACGWRYRVWNVKNCTQRQKLQFKKWYRQYGHKRNRRGRGPAGGSR